MKAPQIIMIVIIAMDIGINLVKHGEYKTNEKYSIVYALIGAAINVGLLYWGGFWG